MPLRYQSSPPVSMEAAFFPAARGAAVVGGATARYKTRRPSVPGLSTDRTKFSMALENTPRGRAMFGGLRPASSRDQIHSASDSSASSSQSKDMMSMSNTPEDELPPATKGFDEQNMRTPQQRGTATPPRKSRNETPFTINGPLKPARLLSIQTELTAPPLDFELKSEAAFQRMLSSQTDLASRLRLRTNSPHKKRSWAGGRYSETFTMDNESADSDSSDEADSTRAASVYGGRPPSATMEGPGSDILDGLMSYGSSGMMDLDMASNMSSPISTHHNSWREPAPINSIKKRKYSATMESDRFEPYPVAKKRRGVSPFTHHYPGSSYNTNFNGLGGNSNFTFPPRSPVVPNGGLFTFGNSSTNFSAAMPVPSRHKRSGSMSTNISMNWSRPGSAQSSPLIRPSSSASNPNPIALGPSVLGAPFGSPFGSVLGAPYRDVGMAGSGSGMNSPSVSSAGFPAYPFSGGNANGFYPGAVIASPSMRPIVRLPERLGSLGNVESGLIGSGGGGGVAGKILQRQVMGTEREIVGLSLD